jgi:hypothetical protein
VGRNRIVFDGAEAPEPAGDRQLSLYEWASNGAQAPGGTSTPWTATMRMPAAPSRSRRACR